MRLVRWLSQDVISRLELIGFVFAVEVLDLSFWWTFAALFIVFACNDVALRISAKEG